MSLTRPLRLLPALSKTSLRPFTTVTRKMAEGDTGSVRYGGDRHGDTWSRREKAAEDLYIKGREKAIMELLKEKIAQQEAALAKDKAILSTMEDQYGHIAEDTWWKEGAQ